MVNRAEVFISIVVLVFLLGLLQTGVNTKKNRRIRQLPLVLLSVVLMGVGIYMCLRYFDRIHDFCCYCRHYFSDYFAYALPPEQAALYSSYLKYTELLAANGVLLLGFALLRLPLTALCGAVYKDRKLLELFSLGLYHYDDDYDEWFLGKQWVNFRRFFLLLAIGLNVAAGLFLALTWLEGIRSDWWMIIFPAAAVVVVNEIYNFINGQTREEFEHSVMGDASDSRRVSNYYKLRAVLEQLLPEPLLSAHTGCEYIGAETPADLLKEKQSAGDEADLITADYFMADGRYKRADVDCTQAAFQLMHRRNVVFFNPFYRDLTDYVTLPLITALLSGKKCVVVCGRRSTAEDVKLWLGDLLEDYSHMRSMWRVASLTDREPECEIGVITFTQIYDKSVINTNREFLRETDFVLLVESSVMLNTSQIALSILAQEMSHDDEAPVYCVFDRKTDGLIDTLSHVLRAEITDVVAMPVPRCTYSSMSWDADGDFHRQQLFDKQTRYLGDGIELAAVAIKNQIPKVYWYGETKMPLRDIKWIAGQYYATICRYIHRPCQQKSLYEKIEFVPNLWSSEAGKEAFVIVEDEFCNMFSMMRAFLTRGKHQAFVNVLSENYLLRDYMRCNRQMFMTDPNAVMSLVPDYAKTERNTILKLLLMMALRPVSEDEVRKEFHLVGLETEDVFATLAELLQRYTFADSGIFTVQCVGAVVDMFTTVTANLYSISDEEFESSFSNSLKSAYYILEEEKDNEGYIDAKLFSHVTQTILPGQLVTYDGKYYMAKHVSPQSGVVLRRASDLLDGRKYYRQLRTYFFDGGQDQIVSSRKIGDIEFTELRMDIHVETSGYLEMSDSHDLRTAKLIDLTADPSVSGFTRRYRNKSVLRVRLPDADERLRFTLCLLLSEVFRSVFPDGWPYLAVVTERPADIDGMLNYMVYPVHGELEKDCIYIVEDSELDLGLLTAVEKHFMQLMELIADFLDWHYDKMREPPSKDPIPKKIEAAEAEEKKKRNIILRMLDAIRKIVGGKKEDEVRIEDPKTPEDGAKPGETPETAKPAGPDGAENQNDPVSGEDDGLPPEEAAPEIAPVNDNEESPSASEDNGDEDMDNEKPAVIAGSAMDIPPAETAEETADETAEPEDYPEDSFEPGDEDPDLVAIDGTDIFENDGMPEDKDYLEDSFQAIGLEPIIKSRYQRECFLKFGFDEIDSRISLDDLRIYLRVRSLANTSLTLARKRELFEATGLDLEAVNTCDFCGLPLSAVSFDRLSDGRVRCNDCAATAIDSLEDFRALFYQTLSMMGDLYDIKFRVPVSVKMTDARTIARGAGMIFVPSTDVAPRVLGYAQRRRGKYSLLVENGSPRLATLDTVVHEMTHIWQYLNWDDGRVLSIYGMPDDSCTGLARDIVYEGMAMWSSIQYLYQIGESYFASQQEAQAEARQDAYGIGFRLYRDQYPLVKDGSLMKYTPFAAFPTLEPGLVKAAVKAQCKNPHCSC